MLGIIRIGAYLLSGLTIWQFAHDGSGGSSLLPIARHLALDPVHGMILGVCSGISNYTGVDVTLIRLIWAAATFYRGFGIIIYILAFIIMPATT